VSTREHALSVAGAVADFVAEARANRLPEPYLRLLGEVLEGAQERARKAE
jgi:hypothetical protein